jgi:colanic acid/amylovoran biosynthesis glycosyltransferase
MKKFPKVAQLITPYLFHTGSWVYSQIKGVNTIQNIILTYKTENLDQFPFNPIYSFYDFNRTKQFTTRVYRKFFGDRYGLFFNPIIKKENPKLFHAHMGYEAVRWLKFVKKTGLPLITTFYGLDVSKLGKIPYWRKCYQELFMYGKYFLAEGNYLKKQLVDLGCPSEKIIVQKLGVDIDNYPKVNRDLLNYNKRVILQVSTFREKKGIEYSLRTIAEVSKVFPNVLYKLIGKGDNSEADDNIKGLIKSLNVEKNVELLGITTHKQMLQIMCESEIFLHPSVTASDGDNEGGAPVSVIEASAVGLPVVSTFHADIPEVVIDGKTGFLVKEKDVDGLAEKIILLLNNLELSKRFSFEGPKHILENYNLKIQIEKLDGIYQRLLSEL